MRGKWLVATAIAAMLLGGIGTAGAARLISGKDVRDRSIQGRDIARNSVYSSNLSAGLRKTIFSQQASSTSPGAQGQQGTQGAKGDTGAQGPQGQQGAKGDTGAQGASGDSSSEGNWGVINRNTIGSPEQELRSGPAAPPSGKGSLNFTVQGKGNGTAGDPDFTPAEKAAFGNETDFVGDALSGIDQIGFSVFTTGEDNARGNPNMPNINIEVDRNGSAAGAPGFSTLVFSPPNSASNQWTDIDATATTPAPGPVGWYYTGSGNTCNQSNPCTFADAKAEYPDATIFTVAVSKGRDFSWQGAIDALRINDRLFDFEEKGVKESGA
jgi:hypothetical protein